MRSWLGGLLASVIAMSLLAQTPSIQGPIVLAYAPSASTQREAARILRLCRWADTSVVRDADALLVVVRTSRSSPLSQTYANFKWLRDDAASLLNESGAQFHVFLYSIRSDQNLEQTVHRSYDVADPGIFTDPLGKPHGSGVTGFGCPF